jgi:sulfide dehydrogenase cytochrome subunit
MTKKLSGLLMLASGALLGFSLTTGALAADLAASCAGCHGTDGVSTDPNSPSIAGASAAYLSATMNDYKKKERPCAEVTVTAGDKKGTKSDMCKAVADVSAADIEQLAKTFSAKKFVRFTQTADAAAAAKGKEIHDKSCNACHSEGGSVADDDAGILAGQPLAYLKAQMADYKAGKRTMPPKMKPKFDALQPADLDALAQYYASFK